jgi:rhodanese-related sulfurtransferase
MRQITAPELAEWLADPDRPEPQLLDVREPWEVAICALPGAIVIPMNEIPTRAGALDPDRPLVCYCHHGVRSLHVGAFLARRGFDAVLNLAGGIDAWARLVDPSCPTY